MFLLGGIFCVGTRIIFVWKSVSERVVAAVEFRGRLRELLCAVGDGGMLVMFCGQFVYYIYVCL